MEKTTAKYIDERMKKKGKYIISICAFFIFLSAVVRVCASICSVL